MDHALLLDCDPGHDDVMAIPTGPLTNIALALRVAPDIGNRIAGISLMGGGTPFVHKPGANAEVAYQPDVEAILDLVIDAVAATA